MAGYPDAHTDPDDTCSCPDHVALRAAKAGELAELTGETPYRDSVVRQAIGDRGVIKPEAYERITGKRARPLRCVVEGMPDELLRHPPREPISVTFIRIDYTMGIAYYAYLPEQEK